ncbi:hypothetical protein GCM10027285_10890 [Oleiagrimonas citrea]|uniref:Uncharacterized protein n=1 Tax=Oleiagrimonas citrea TaxID=1665687 RepID=A0A846ZLD7_9GAMM|nr:hypothetical protein [Oleiagrimonas citrea]NKZ38350.1 hypothetical protein [Oleiagrimonas citrea]
MSDDLADDMVLMVGARLQRLERENAALKKYIDRLEARRTAIMAMLRHLRKAWKPNPESEHYTEQDDAWFNDVEVLRAALFQSIEDEFNDPESKKERAAEIEQIIAEAHRGSWS